MITHKPYILYVSEEGSTLLSSSQPRMVLDDTTEIKAHLASKSHLDIILLYDGPWQRFLVEEIPSLSTSDTRKLLLRRLKDAFPDSLFYATRKHKRNQYITAALDLQGSLKSWHEFLLTLPFCSWRVCSLPLEMSEVMRKLSLHANAEWTLSLSAQRNTGIRFTALKNGCLVFSRVHPCQQSDGSIQSNFKAMTDYLARFGLSPSSSCALLALIPDKLKAEVKQIVFGTMNWRVLSPAEALDALHLPQVQPSTPSFEVFWLLSLARSRQPKTFFTTPSLTAKRRQLQLTFWGRRVLWLLSALLIFILLHNISIAAQHQFIISDYSDRNDGLQRKIESLQAGSDNGSTSASDLRMAAVRMRLFAPEEPALLLIAPHLRKSLEDHFRIEQVSGDASTTLIKLRCAIACNDPGTIKPYFAAFIERLSHSLNDSGQDFLIDQADDLSLSVTLRRIKRGKP